MSLDGLTPEQAQHWEKHVAGIGHNHGPIFVEHAAEILDNVAKHPALKNEAVRIRVMLDMLKSHSAGEFSMPRTTRNFVIMGLSIIACITFPSILVTPVSVLLLDAPVFALVVAALRGEIEGYIDWRAQRDPEYLAIKDALKVV